MSAQVQTVLGPVSVDDLEFTLIHEHLKVGYPGWEVDTTFEFDREGEVDAALFRR